MQSPNRKLEKLLTERDYYHKEVCRLREDVTKATIDKSEVSLRRPRCCKFNQCYCTV